MSDLVHLSVLAGPSEPSVFSILRPVAGEKVLDVTLGLGGHGMRFCEAIGGEGSYTGLDADLTNLEVAKERLGNTKAAVQLHHTNFRNVGDLLPQTFDIVFADLGLSSPHLDDASRGFTFRTDAPLDMRFDRNAGRTAAEFLRAVGERELLVLLREYGDVPRPHILAQKLKALFIDKEKSYTTGDLRACVEAMYGYKAPSILPLVFQAIRIAVNDETGALRSLLEALPALLRAGGRAGIISYHSLEDRMVKQAFKALSAPTIDPHTGAVVQEADFAVLTKRPVVPSDAEIEMNPRARSAKFRALLRKTS